MIPFRNRPVPLTDDIAVLAQELKLRLASKAALLEEQVITSHPYILFSMGLYVILYILFARMRASQKIVIPDFYNAPSKSLRPQIFIQSHPHIRS